MIHFGLPTTFFAKHILHSAMESCFAVALTLPQTVFEIGCGNFFSNLDYCINYAFCSSSLFSQIFTNFPQNIYQSHCLYSAYATSLCNNSRNSSLCSLEMLSRPLTRYNWLSWPGSERHAPVWPLHVQTTLCTVVQSAEWPQHRHNNRFWHLSWRVGFRNENSKGTIHCHWQMPTRWNEKLSFYYNVN